MKTAMCLLGGLKVFPIAPILVVILTHMLCVDIQKASFYRPGEDGGEVEPALALFMIPTLLIALSGLLLALSLLDTLLVQRAAFTWWKWPSRTIRVGLTLAALLLFFAPIDFLTGAAVTEHWQTMIAFVLSTLGLVLQQGRKLRFQ